MPRQNLIALRRGTAAAWISADPILDAGEPGFETDTGKLKIGDGVTAYTALPSAAGVTGTVNFVVDGGGATVTTGIKGDVVMPFDGEFTRATLLADQSGSIVIDIWKDVYASFPPTGADSIVAAAPPTISTAIKSQDSTLTGWTTAFAAGDVLRFNVNSATSITRATLALDYVKQ